MPYFHYHYRYIYIPFIILILFSGFIFFDFLPYYQSLANINKRTMLTTKNLNSLKYANHPVTINAKNTLPLSLNQAIQHVGLLAESQNIFDAMIQGKPNISPGMHTLHFRTTADLAHILHFIFALNHTSYFCTIGNFDYQSAENKMFWGMDIVVYPFSSVKHAANLPHPPPEEQIKMIGYLAYADKSEALLRLPTHEILAVKIGDIILRYWLKIINLNPHQVILTSIQKKSQAIILRM